MNYFADERGYFGDYGGAFVPEMLRPNIEELQQSYKNCLSNPKFIEEYESLLKEYVGRPTPLYYAKRLSQHLNYHVYLKREDLNHTGAHKINNAIGQILIAKHIGKTRVIAETGAGQHGVATATVCALMNIDCTVYMGEVDMARQLPNVKRMKMLGAKVIPVTGGTRVLKDATNEAMRDWISNPNDTHYLIGSALGPHPFPTMVAYFQSVISKEIKEQCISKMSKQKPDYIIACVGGGSNAIGSFYHFLEDTEVKLISVEAAGKGLDTEETAATISLGTEGVLHGSKSFVLQNEDGQIKEVYSISAGLDYPGIGPQHAFLHKKNRVKFVSATDKEALVAGKQLMRLEGIIPALETAHALAHLDKMKVNQDETVVLCLSGRGDKDMEAYCSEENL